MSYATVYKLPIVFNLTIVSKLTIVFKLMSSYHIFSAGLSYKFPNKFSYILTSTT